MSDNIPYYWFNVYSVKRNTANNIIDQQDSKLA